jgi:uncharacterized protein (DUF2141 family)
MLKKQLMVFGFSIIAALGALAQSAGGDIRGSITVPEGTDWKKVVVLACLPKDEMCHKPAQVLNLKNGRGIKYPYRFKNLPAGQYAIWAFIDDGDNLTFDHGEGVEPIGGYTDGDAMTPKFVTPPAKGINIKIEKGM